MSIEWWRSWHGAPTDPKWLSVARRAQVDPVTVVAMVWTLFDHASQTKDRGDVSRYVTEPVCDFLAVTLEDAERVMKALRDIGVITKDGRLSAWEERQPKKEDETAAERKRAERQRKLDGRDSSDVTPSHAPSRSVTTDKEKIRKEKDKEKKQIARERAESEFGIWYAAYPRHVGRPKALEKYLSARERVDAATLLAAAMLAKKQYADTEEKYIPHPATWLHQERYLDEVSKKTRGGDDAVYKGVIV